MMLQFWNSDEEFPANLKIMWDENILDYVHFETAQFIASHVRALVITAGVLLFSGMLVDRNRLRFLLS